MYNLFYFENGLIDYSGHSFNTAKLIIKKFTSCDKFSNIYLVGDSCCKVEIKESFKFLPFFISGPVYKFNRNFAYKTFFLFKMIFYIFGGLTRVNSLIAKNSFSYLYFNTALAWHLIAILIFLILNKCDNIMFIVTLRLSLRKNKIKGHFYFLNKIIFMLLKHYSDKIIYVTDSEVLQKEFEEDFGILITTLCIPHNPSHFKSSLIKYYSNYKYCIGILGPSRKHKCTLNSIEALLEIDGKYIDIAKQVILIIHAFGELQGEILLLVEKFHNIEIVIRRSQLLYHDYYNDLYSCDLVLLNYDSSMYSSNTSGIFMESMCLNIDALITKNTWMSLQNKNYGMCIEVDNDKNLIISSIIKLYLERNCMKVFKAGRDNFSKYHSIDNFLFQFMKLIK